MGDHLDDLPIAMILDIDRLRLQARAVGHRLNALEKRIADMERAVGAMREQPK